MIAIKCLQVMVLFVFIAIPMLLNHFVGKLLDKALSELHKDIENDSCRYR